MQELSQSASDKIIVGDAVQAEQNELQDYEEDSEYSSSRIILNKTAAILKHSRQRNTQIHLSLSLTTQESPKKVE